MNKLCFQNKKNFFLVFQFEGTGNHKKSSGPIKVNIFIANSTST